MRKFYTILFLLLFAATAVLAQQEISSITEQKEECADVKSYDLVDKEAVPEGGMRAFDRFFLVNFVYPQAAILHDIEGTTFIRFIVGEDGTVICADVIKSRRVGYGLDEEAVRVLKRTKWKPARLDGELVNQKKILPFKFVLPEPSAEQHGN